MNRAFSKSVIFSKFKIAAQKSRCISKLYSRNNSKPNMLDAFIDLKYKIETLNIAKAASEDSARFVHSTPVITLKVVSTKQPNVSKGRCIFPLLKWFVHLISYGMLPMKQRFSMCCNSLVLYLPRTFSPVLDSQWAEKIYHPQTSECCWLSTCQESALSLWSWPGSWVALNAMCLGRSVARVTKTRQLLSQTK